MALVLAATVLGGGCVPVVGTAGGAAAARGAGEVPPVAASASTSASLTATARTGEALTLPPRFGTIIPPDVALLVPPLPRIDPAHVRR